MVNGHQLIVVKSLLYISSCEPDSIRKKTSAKKNLHLPSLPCFQNAKKHAIFTASGPAANAYPAPQLRRIWSRCRDTWKRCPNNLQQPHLWLFVPFLHPIFKVFCRTLFVSYYFMLMYSKRALENFLEVNVPNSAPHSQVQICAAIELLTGKHVNHVKCHVVVANECHTNNKSSHGSYTHSRPSITWQLPPIELHVGVETFVRRLWPGTCGSNMSKWSMWKCICFLRITDMSWPFWPLPIGVSRTRGLLKLGCLPDQKSSKHLKDEKENILYKVGPKTSYK